MSAGTHMLLMRQCLPHVTNADVVYSYCWHFCLRSHVLSPLAVGFAVEQVQEVYQSLRVDTGPWGNNVHLDEQDKVCLVCKSSQHVEDEHHYISDCPLYSHIRARHANLCFSANFSCVRPFCEM